MKNLLNQYKNRKNDCQWSLAIPKQRGSIVIPVLLVTFSTLAALAWFTTPGAPQFGGKAIRHVNTKEKVVALTFDDGPNPPFTNQILEVLKKHNVKATFFVVGKCAVMHQDLVKEIYKAGHELGNHTWSHRILIGKSSSFIRKQIESTDGLLCELGYEGPIHFRAPNGLKLLRLPKILSHQKRPHILFDVVAWDWTNPGIETIVSNVTRDVRRGSIILLHDGGGDREQTVVATDIIITALKQQGFSFVTISELLAKRASCVKNAQKQ